ncbi:hypothetical protein Acsp06_46670 [Actinomycetospora sp. NBRC 106375]|uniref:DUF1990 family protein n=1 Tax=Actinomycetospora sp. NBRC 106375 TaxID=3032207 RepID=UPI0024A55E1B|nr:DUF1990 family protein [Actinomycetospora sp. NBRC 106375]GLZ48482.1 hypothetical protein Acsp06_46670 [Actinomycetospora sp. NBRC 106375]
MESADPSLGTSHWVPGPRQVLREALMLTRLPRGVAGMLWRCVRPDVAVHVVEEVGDHRDLPPRLVDVTPRDQPLEAGHGPALHREFRVRVVGAQRGATELIDALARDMNRAVVPGVARFDYVAASGAMRVGEELVVRMPGPWDGPVRVLSREPTAFRLGTLTGHLEAGQIEFAARDLGDDLEFVITTWARAGDVVADVLYSRLGLAKQIQYLLWVEFCVRAASLAGGRTPDGVRVLTRTVSWPEIPDGNSPSAV